MISRSSSDMSILASSYASCNTGAKRPDSILPYVSGCGGVRVACGTGAMITGADVFR
jgi:hypothetical protein